MERPRPGDVPPATATRTINIMMIQHDLWILRSRSIVKAYSVISGDARALATGKTCRKRLQY
jgi:hypothetical protein